MKWRIQVFFILLIPLALRAQQEEYLVPGHNLFLNKIAAQQSKYPQWNGAGIRLSIKEFRFDSLDVDIAGRIIPNPNAATNVTSHANIMASLAGGAGNADWSGLGAAPGCRLVSSSFVGLLPDPDYGQTGITVQNHSYGIDIHNFYDERAAAYDQSTLDYPSLLHIFSAGNKGDSAAVDGLYNGIQGFGNLSGAFKMAKNVLLVGSVDSFGVPALRSSRGPAYDGRIKPDLMAFGKGGSSESAALTSGVAAVLQQALLETTDTLPYSDLVRAILINSADDLAAPGPDYETGFGQLNALEAAILVSQQSYATGNLHTGDTVDFPVLVDNQTSQLKVTLVWTDQAALPGANTALHHNLDLRLISPGGDIHMPWVLSTFPHADSLKLPATKGTDTINTVEQVTVSFPQPGLWKIRVSADSTISLPHHFAISWDLDSLRQFIWYYPLKESPAFSGEQVLLQWYSKDTTALGTIQWRDVRTTQWKPVADEVSLQKGHLYWQLPDTFAPIQLVMEVHGNMYFSDTFLVHPALRTRVGFNCSDSLMLFWNTVGSDATYLVYGLDASSMTPLLVIQDTLLVFQKEDFKQTRFAVRPVWDMLQLPGARSPAPDIFYQGVACYFRQFDAEWLGGPAISLKLSLGTDYALDHITLEKLTATGFVALLQEDAAGKEYEWQDNQPRSGINTYRAILHFKDGTSLASEEALGYYSDNNKWWIFPNPVGKDTPIQIISLAEELIQCQIYDGNGRLILEQELESHFTALPVEGLGTGVYFIRLLDGAEQVGQLKLIIL